MIGLFLKKTVFDLNITGFSLEKNWICGMPKCIQMFNEFILFLTIICP